MALNRVDVVDIVFDGVDVDTLALVDVDLDVDLVHVDLDVELVRR